MLSRPDVSAPIAARSENPNVLPFASPPFSGWRKKMFRMFLLFTAAVKVVFVASFANRPFVNVILSFVVETVVMVSMVYVPPTAAVKSPAVSDVTTVI